MDKDKVGLTKEAKRVPYGTKPGQFETSNLTLSHERGVSKVSERVSAAEGASEASSPEQVNE